MDASDFAVEHAIAVLLGDAPNADADNVRSCNLSSLLRSGCEAPAVDSVISMLGSSASSVHRSFWSVSARTLATVLSTCIASETHALFHRLENTHSSTYSTSRSFFLQDASEHNQVAGSYESTVSEISIRRLLENILFVLRGSEFEGPLALELLEELLKITSMFPSMKFRHAGVCLLYERENNVTISSFSEHLIRFSLEKREIFYDNFNPTTRKLNEAMGDKDASHKNEERGKNWRIEAQGLLFGGHRLLLWRLQPDLLWQDLSAILQKLSQRPLLYLKHEFRHTYCWRNLVLGLALGPDVFFKARTTLNGWLLVSGDSCLFELKEELGAAVRDVLEHPVSWGITLETGIDLPPLSAFYTADMLSKVKILMMTPNLSGLIQLVHMIKEDISEFARVKSDQQPEDSAPSMRFKKTLNFTEKDLHNPDSLWMQLMDFPIWVQYAAFLLFLSPQFDNAINLISHAHNTHSGEDSIVLKQCSIAAMYISWNFNPCDNTIRDLVVRTLFEMVKSWWQINEIQIGLMEISRVKRRKLMVNFDDVRAMANNKKNSTVNADHCLQTANKETSLIKNRCHAVECWLTTFRDSCYLLDTYGQKRPQSRARFHLSGSQCIGVSTTELRNHSDRSEISSFFSTFPLVALACTPELQTQSTVHAVLHFIMSEYGYWSSGSHGDGDVTVPGTFICENHGEMKGAACREPSHRTEDFKDPCTAPFCMDFSLHASSRTAVAIARVLKFLETLDVMKISMSMSLDWNDYFKEMVVMQLTACIRRWSEHAINMDCLTMLGDLQRRVTLWLSGAGLKAGTLEAFHGVLKDLNAIISSLLVKRAQTDV